MKAEILKIGAIAGLALMCCDARGAADCGNMSHMYETKMYVINGGARSETRLPDCNSLLPPYDTCPCADYSDISNIYQYECLCNPGYHAYDQSRSYCACQICSDGYQPDSRYTSESCIDCPPGAHSNVYMAVLPEDRDEFTDCKCGKGQYYDYSFNSCRSCPSEKIGAQTVSGTTDSDNHHIENCYLPAGEYFDYPDYILSTGVVEVLPSDCFYSN